MAIHSHCSCLGDSMEEEPGRLQSIGSQRVRHDLVTKQHTYTKAMERKEGRNKWFNQVDSSLTRAENLEIISKG